MNIELNETELRMIITALETEKRAEYNTAMNSADPVAEGVAKLNVAAIVELRNKLRQAK